MDLGGGSMSRTTLLRWKLISNHWKPTQGTKYDTLGYGVQVLEGITKGILV